MSFSNGRSYECPNCGGSVSRGIGEIDECIFKFMPEDEEISVYNLAKETNYSEDEMHSAIHSLIKLGYVEKTPNLKYKFSLQGVEK